jgi:hypothetical protein
LYKPAVLLQQAKLSGNEKGEVTSLSVHDPAELNSFKVTPYFGDIREIR